MLRQDLENMKQLKAVGKVDLLHLTLIFNKWEGGSRNPNKRLVCDGCPATDF